MQDKCIKIAISQTTSYDGIVHINLIYDPGEMIPLRSFASSSAYDIYYFYIYSVPERLMLIIPLFQETYLEGYFQKCSHICITDFQLLSSIIKIKILKLSHNFDRHKQSLSVCVQLNMSHVRGVRFDIALHASNKLWK